MPYYIHCYLFLDSSNQVCSVWKKCCPLQLGGVSSGYHWVGWLLLILQSLIVLYFLSFHHCPAENTGKLRWYWNTVTVVICISDCIPHFWAHLLLDQIIGVWMLWMYFDVVYVVKQHKYCFEYSCTKICCIRQWTRKREGVSWSDLSKALTLTSWMSSVQVGYLLGEFVLLQVSET